MRDHRYDRDAETATLIQARVAPEDKRHALPQLVLNLLLAMEDGALKEREHFLRMKNDHVAVHLEYRVRGARPPRGARGAEESSLLGGWTSRVVRVAIRLSNLGTTARQVTVCDRVPVSEIEQVVIAVADPKAYLLAKEARRGEAQIPQTTDRTIDPNGIVTWQVPLPPRSRAAVTLEYKIKSQRGVTGL